MPQGSDAYLLQHKAPVASPFRYTSFVIQPVGQLAGEYPRIRQAVGQHAWWVAYLILLCCISGSIVVQVNEAEVRISEVEVELATGWCCPGAVSCGRVRLEGIGAPI